MTGFPNINTAEKIAEFAHMGQTYDTGIPYVEHLRSVVGVLERFGVEDAVVICAGYCHDMLEDTRASYNDLKNALGEEVAETVFAVSSELGRNREERNKRTYPKIKDNVRATMVKLADRIANLEFGSARGGKVAMYRKEYPGFREAIWSSIALQNTPSGQILTRMWAHLDQLMKE